MNTEQWVFGSVAQPLFQRLRGDRRFSHLAELKRNERLTVEEIGSLQLRQLKALLTHAGNNSEYYRNLFAKNRFNPAALRSVTDLAVIPPLTKAALRDSLDSIIA